MKIKDQTRKLAAGCSKHCFEVVDRTDGVSNIYTARRRWRGLKRFSKSIISVFIYRRLLMAHLKSFITRYSKVYIGLVLFIWIAFFFVPWDKPVLGIFINLLIMQKVLLVFGILSILMALLSKKVSLFVFGLICCLSFWINLFILFAILPIFGN